jgi:hypothetical protein
MTRESQWTNCTVGDDTAAGEHVVDETGLKNE